LVLKQLFTIFKMRCSILILAPWAEQRQTGLFLLLVLQP
jgi:hypothetical protein